jgi:Kef-type K+ transport system membrane component KefB
MNRTILIYVAMVLAAVAVFLYVDHQGRTLAAPAAAVDPAAARDGAADVLAHVLLALVAVVVVGRLLGRLFLLLGQPPVIAEVVAGIVLGPSVLGLLSPAASAFVLPPSVAPFLGTIAQLGVILYMFVIGLELDPGALRGQIRATVVTSHASIAVPFVLGSALALYLYPRFSSPEVPFTGFALFLGVAMSITAFPVLARILADRDMTRTRLGSIALACAAIGDVTAWCLLAFVVGVVQARVENAVRVGMLTAGFIALMFLAVGPALRWLIRRWGDRTPAQDAVAFGAVLVLLAALATETIGVHAIFGAFLLGTVIPRDSAVARTVKTGLGDLVTVLLLPAFFALTGMRTQIGLLSGGYEWAVCGLIVLVATAGKFGGTLGAARLTGLGWRDGAGLGILMNTRGLMELIVLNVGLDLGVISPTLFAMMVLMALVTTVATTPVLEWLVPPSAVPEKGDRLVGQELRG